LLSPSAISVLKSHNIVHWTEFDRGGHFPAMEVPDLLAEDLRRFLSQLQWTRGVVSFRY
jgi:pimeloyl-ACP methyl ester carboxylesterase